MNPGDFFGDLWAFIALGESARAGGYSGLYPYPFAMIWGILSLVPYPILAVMLIAISAGILTWLFRRRAFLWLFYIPVIYSFLSGQLLMIWLGLMNLANGPALALLTLKPQLFIVALPTLADRWKEVRRSFLLSCAAIYIPSLIIRPAWPIEWVRLVLADGRMTDGYSASAWGMPITCIVLAGMAFAAIVIVQHPTAQRAWVTITTAFNPALRVYDYSILSGASPWLIPASWLAWAVMRSVQHAWPFAALGIVIALSARESMQASRLRQGYREIVMG